MDNEALIDAGVDIDAALERVLRNEALMDQLFSLYLSDTSCADLRQALDEGDDKAAEEAAHALKGVASNLSMDKVTGLAADCLTAVREGNLGRAKELLPELEQTHEKVCRAIRQPSA